MEYFIGNRIEKMGREVTIEYLKENDIILIYIGAEWSSPCRNMLPSLLGFYSEAQTIGARIEIVFISCDSSEEEFREDIRNMPWCYVPFKEHGIRELVTNHYDIVGIPTVLLVNEKGTCLSSSCLADIATKSTQETIDSWQRNLF